LSVADFLNAVRNTHQTGAATEHSYRPALQKLFNSLDPAVSALNEPKRVKVGAPDFVFRRGDISVGHCEAKDIDVDVRTKKGPNAEQKARYLGGLPNLIYTNCLDWVFYRDGEEVAHISIADFLMGIQPRPDQFEALEHRLRDFIAQTPQSITSPKDLAERMAGKAVLIKDILFNSLKEDKDKRTELMDQYGAFKEHLIHDITAEDFADMYAETIAYGMFAARLHDQTLPTFSRQEALQLLPKSNPFLRNLFGYIAGPNLDERISWIIDDLAKVFQATNVRSIMKGFGTTTQRNDPFLHFYETFLAAYNPKKRKARGVWYTPEPVVNFIVRAVDEVLKTEFELPLGLADTSKVTIDWDTGQKGLTKKGAITKSSANAKTQKEVHRVQILDPATGTGTFLAEAIKQIAPKVKKTAPGSWSGYVEEDLIPRLHGFELLMASYAMCHMKLDMILTELEYKPKANPPRLGVYLTNSLEEGDPPNQTLPFAQWLSNEVRQANAVKRDMPIMCVIGNPPYAIRSSNLSSYQVSLINRYRSVDGKPIKEKSMLQFEKNLNNDYVKFIALAEQLIRKNDSGALGFITSHGFLSSPSYRGMRQQLMQTFDSIYIVDLHGNSDIKEDVPNGGADENIFDIKQGVSIIIGTRRVGGCSSIQYRDVWGSREEKYAFLAKQSLQSTEWATVTPKAPHYDFRPRDEAVDEGYQKYPSITEIMPQYSSGVITARDDFAIDESRDALRKRIHDFTHDKTKDEAELREKFSLRAKEGWSVLEARRKLLEITNPDQCLQRISYRPFDTRYIFFDESVVWTTARATMDSLVDGKNICLATARSEKSGTCSHFFVSNKLVETKFSERTTQSAVFPLYLHSSGGLDATKKRTNIAPSVIKKYQEILGEAPKPLELFDYIYGVLHSLKYREKFRAFLRSDFPRIPWPKSKKVFEDVSSKGTQLRRLHLMEAAIVGETPFPFKGDGDRVVAGTEFKAGQIWINDSQYFEGATAVSWDFFIGGYQPAQKWLKDRKGRALTFADIKHYQQILKVLSETDRIMKTIALPLE